ncbi:hypothetical protein CDQ84_12250 [Clostridium thermosuccinogenes]|jgi:transcriptional regulator with XRE-family HTH domain|uniref:HTH cro/C1-type domain-containing protein n=1 Tax=Clostridium thermosuccinogenes TaxID=84032 RepID=A0A2K2FBX6_9CLOT|nr:helix-turn-helix transcriptional regulator [Pseudoclostridium thermosuccinogenes]AUS95035.1 hypothetical protein CDO33_00350 [Pseudoclostridium thermosuccinogenes]PNT91407.1 hypothetical protein CDQ83_16565 [Pseudoclostridium thermosuccinogenes]PNT96268.1 hypothetical protein CDQ85_12290 [Pseudoclostridium thermosuccinogenes]PNT97950.1 hypothetical protein CDQ84_12250 [Pseudoclostridium thermosuccinogenes]
MSILEIIQDLCAKKGINPSKLEMELGFGKGAIYKWDKNSPSVDKIQKVADYFNVSTDYLLGRTEIKDTSGIKTLAAHRLDGYDKPLTDDEVIAVNAFLEAYRKGKQSKKD